MNDLLGLGGEMLPQAPGKDDPGNATREAQWMQYFKNPTISAALFNMGTAMMQPKWNQASILPDALNAGARTVAVNEEEEYKRDQTDEQNRLRQQEGTAGRANQMAIAKLQADSRLEVAQERIAGMLAGQRIKAELKGPPGSTQEAQLFNNMYRDAFKQLQKENSEAWLTKAPLKTEDQMKQIAQQRAQEALQNYRLQFGAPQPRVPGTTVVPGVAPDTAIPGEKTRQNPAPAGPPVGTPGAPGLPNSTRQNTPPDNPGYLAKPKRPDQGVPTSEAIKKLGGAQDPRIKQIMEDDTYYNHLRSRVADPEELDRFRRTYRMVR
ncbi:MAG: hypothetical protein IPK54_10130 [Dokdonella sp.]|uniref:hypothetical protein n=1 Tax=Dokdonella sp. TaxID=2291710 RepID=UPI0025C47AC5|nr:hypothetical protein [Dokdonella sp.]MBK8123889.1 hypothetical protein [Dokdonella sp.]